MGPSALSSAVLPSMKVPSAKMTSSPYPAVTPVQSQEAQHYPPQKCAAANVYIIDCILSTPVSSCRHCHTSCPAGSSYIMKS